MVPSCVGKEGTSWSDILPGKLEGAAGPASQSQQTVEGSEFRIEWHV